MATPTAASRPGRTLGLLALVIVALYAGMFLTGHRTPKLALDLRGGTQVTLSAHAEGGGRVTPAAMNQAVEIIRKRVNAFGVSEAEVARQGGNNIIVSIPGRNQGRTAEQVGQTALLYFRPVLAIGAPGPATAATPTPTPGSTASPSGKASTSPSAKASTPAASPSQQGRALGDALTGARAATATPTPTPSATSTPTSAATAPATLSVSGTVPTELQEEFATFDCTEAKNQGGKQNQPDKAMVACDRDGGSKYALGPAEVAGKNVKSATATLPQSVSSSGWEVDLTFDSKGTKDFANSTRKLAANTNASDTTNVSDRFAIVLDGVVVSAPAVQNGAITGGQAQITGNFGQTEAQDLANVLKYGALPLAFAKSDVTQVSATLGSDQLSAGIIAGIVGLLLVVLYSILYYRGLAMVTIVSLVVAGMLTYALAVLLGPVMGFTLSLPGIAGLIVAVGITADSFVVFFERLRDEVRDGRTLRAAVEHGWTRARRTIIVADLVSIFAAGALYVLSVGSVKGFAFTLGATTIIDLVVVFLFTKPLITYLARTKFFGGGHRLSGLDPIHLGARPKPAPIATGRRTAGAKEA